MQGYIPTPGFKKRELLTALGSHQVFLNFCIRSTPLAKIIIISRLKLKGDKVIIISRLKLKRGKVIIISRLKLKGGES